MIERITEDLFRIPVPLPNNPLKELNAYLIRGKDRNILIDTGFRREECREALQAGLDEINVRMEETDIVATHLHSDHVGLAPDFIAEGRSIYMSAVDHRYMTGNPKDGKADPKEGKWARTNSLLAKENFPVEILEQSARINPARSMAPNPSNQYAELEDGDVLEVGSHKLRAILTPGHTPGQLCFWLEDEDILFSADHVLFDITPNITNWPMREDSLGDYLASLKDIRKWPARMTLPAHRKPGDLQARVDALLEHHDRRLNEALDILRANPGLPAYDLAGKMTWSIRAKGWDDFPSSQKFFAVGECISHLDYLRVRGLVRRETDENGINHNFAV